MRSRSFIDRRTLSRMGFKSAWWKLSTPGLGKTFYHYNVDHIPGFDLATEYPHVKGYGSGGGARVFKIVHEHVKTPPFYVGEVWPVVSNTQGGPVHNAEQQILDVDARPISRLYSAGELGSAFGFLYMSGGVT